jgi:hypothetical protein
VRLLFPSAQAEMAERGCGSCSHLPRQKWRRGGTAVVPICTGRNDGEGEGVRQLFPSAQAELTERERGYGSCSHLHRQNLRRGRGCTAVVPICTGRNDGEGEGVRQLFPSAQAEVTERERGYGSCSHLHRQK